MSAFEVSREYETVNLLRHGGAVKVELNRPEALNAWNEQFGLDLLDALRTCADDESVRAVLITGAGRAFSSGADLKAGFDLTDDGKPDLRRRLTERYHPIMVAIRTMPKPVIAAVNGPAVGIGASLAFVADLVLAGESAYFLLAFVNIGLVPDGGSSIFLPARIGFTRAMEMAMLGERVPAAQALEWGLANRVVADDRLADEAEALVERLAAGPTRSYAGSKRQLNRFLFSDMEGQLDFEATIQQEQGASQDFVEGVTAFVEKRAARFSGR